MEYIAHEDQWSAEDEHDAEGIADHSDSEQKHADFWIDETLLLLSSKPRYSITRL